MKRTWISLLAFLGATLPLVAVEGDAPIQKNAKRSAQDGISVLPNRFSSIGVYDVDGDGKMELVGFRNKKFSIVNSTESIHDFSLGSGDITTYSIINVWRCGRDGMLQFEVDGGELYVGSSRRYDVFSQSAEGQCVQTANKASIVADIDNDGNKDFVFADGTTQYKRSITIHSPLADSRFGVYQQAITNEMTPTQAANSGTWVGMLKGMLANSMFVDGVMSSTTPAGEAAKIVMAQDLNGDGIRDLIGIDGLLYSCDDNKYYRRTTNEVVFPCDIDGDGEVDYVCYDGSKLYVVTNLVSGQETRRDLYSNTRLDNVLFRDFDHDNDIDILAFIGPTTTSNDSYFIFLRNNGDGTFRRKEQNFADTPYQLVECRDYDADGCYELLVRIKDYSSPDFTLLKVNNNFTMITLEEDLTLNRIEDRSTTPRNVVLGDFDNDGITEFYTLLTYGNSYIWNTYGHLTSQTVTNTAPQKMAMPTAVFMPETNRLKIAWELGQDAETSACDLTYELRIGTQPGAGDVLRAESAADGKRMTIREGNQGTMLQTLFNAASLKPGTYYIAVQAIDQGGLGGQFSEELVYEHDLQTPAFYVSASSVTTADTLQVYIKNVIPEATYSWTLSEGEVLEQDATGAKLLFHRQGNHEIGLSMSVDGTNYQATPVTVAVSAMKYKQKWNELGGYINYSPSVFFDVDQDGYIDLWRTGGYDKVDVFKNQGDGSYEKVLLSTFADLNGRVVTIYDYNRDGYPDFIFDGSDKGNVFLNYGEQDFDFDYKTVAFDGIYYNSPLIDLNNDGLLDVKSIYKDVVDNGIYASSHKYGVTWTQDGTNYIKQDIEGIDNVDWNSSNIVDVNRDGFPDIVYRKDNYDSQTLKHQYTFYYRLKDNSYLPNYNEAQPMFVVPENLGMNLGSYQIADFDNDGILDLAFTMKVDDGQTNSDSDDHYALYFIKGKAEGNSSDVAQMIDGVRTFKGALDLNNDGFLDIPYIGMSIASYNGFSYTYKPQSLLLKSNFDYEIVSADADGNDTNVYFYGDIDYVAPLTDSGDILVKGYRHATTIPNQKPGAPAQVAVKQTQDGMLITWSDAVDKETPAAQMRYNISVKRKGKKGDGAFVISPMNGLKDEAAIVPGYDYKQSTQMLIPSIVLTAGETYEIQVQAIDLWGAHSPMTAPVEFVMDNTGYIEATDRIARDTETLIALRAAQADSYSIDLGEGGEVVKEHGGGQYTVKWNTTGVKQYSITAGTATISSQIAVVERVDVSFELPEVVYAGAPVTVTVSDEMAQQSANVGVYCDGATVSYWPGSKTATVTFPTTGTYELVSCYTDAVRGNEYRRTVVISEEMPKAEIAFVTVENGRFVVAWPEQPAFVKKVVVYKESNKTGSFLPVDTVSAAAGNTYVDASSNANVASCRYRIAWLADNHQASDWSEAHKPLHVMLSISPLGGFNIMWNAYEGVQVANYTILRGTSEDTMQPIDMVSGMLQSYTDLNVSGDELYYYAVAFTPGQPAGASRRAGHEEDIRSNVMKSSNAIKLVSANRVEIIAISDELKLTDESPTLQLYALVLPVYSTISRVAWTIVEGADQASINNDGLLSGIKGAGTIKVRATTLDGSNLTAEIEITNDMSSQSEDVPTDIVEVEQRSVTHTDAVYSIDGRKVRQGTTSISGLPSGLYIVNGRKVVVK